MGHFLNLSSEFGPVVGPMSWRAVSLSLAASSLVAAGLSVALQGPEHLLPALAIGTLSPLCWLPMLKRTPKTAPSPHQHTAAVETALEGASHMDTTTGLLNRIGFIEQSKDAFARARSGDALISAVLIDVDDLKNVNETHGTAAGDAVLAHVAKLIQLNIQPQVDVCARYAGAAFVLLLPEADYAWTSAFCERLRGILSNHPVPFEGNFIPMSASFGISSILPADSDVDMLIRRARRAMESAKAHGPNSIEVSPDQQSLPLAA